MVKLELLHHESEPERFGRRRSDLDALAVGIGEMAEA